MVRLLRRAEVEDLVDLPAAIACMDRLYRDQAEGKVTAEAPTTMRSDQAMLMVRSGSLAGQHRLGFRITRARGPDASNRAPRGWALVWDSPDGELMAVVEYPFSDLRVSATIALAVDKLAGNDVHTVGVIGTGGISWSGLAGIAAVRRPAEVRVFSREQDHRVRFANRARKELELEADAVDSAQAAVEGADLVLVATSAGQPALEVDWLPDECLVVGAGNRPELGPDFYRKAGLIVTTSKVHEMHVGEWPLVTLIKNEEIGWDTVSELGEVVSGQVKRPRGLTVFREAQGGFSDIALASFAHEQAAALGRGVNWELD
jgi:alanine dehydrogenase